MIKLTNFTAETTPLQEPLEHADTPVQNVQSGKWGWRKIKHSKNLITAESSSGGSVCFVIDDLWKMLECHDPKLCVPKPTRDESKPLKK